MSKIASKGDLYNLSSAAFPGWSSGNQCPRKQDINEKAEDNNYIVSYSNSYANNQLVQLADISLDTGPTTTLVIASLTITNNYPATIPLTGNATIIDKNNTDHVILSLTSQSFASGETWSYPGTPIQISDYPCDPDGSGSIYMDWNLYYGLVAVAVDCTMTLTDTSTFQQDSFSNDSGSTSLKAYFNEHNTSLISVSFEINKVV
jgi:hypothetical protein